ncbi:MAG: hypothetical protein K6T17_07405 [Fimbriimonadales bacterium]|nr:hypothetical protein [Fimbriimonadales bacterium]
MRSYHFLLLSLSLALLLSCSPKSPSGTSASLTRRWHIGISVPAADHGWTAGVKWWAEQAMKIYPNVEWTFSTAKNSEQQISDIETMMVKGVDALVVLARTSHRVVGPRCRPGGLLRRGLLSLRQRRTGGSA